MPALPTNSFLRQPSRYAVSSVSSGSDGKPSAQPQSLARSALPAAERQRGLAWPQASASASSSSSSCSSVTSSSSSKASLVQVTAGGGQLTGTVGSVTIQAQQYLEGMWSISRVNNFLPQPSPAQGVMGGADRGVTASEAPLVTASSPGASSGSSTSSTSSVSLTPCRQRSSSQLGPCQAGPPSMIPTTSASSIQNASGATSFFIRAAQKLNLSAKRKKHQPPALHPQEPSIYTTNFSGILQVSPPPAPPCLLRTVSKVKVMMRICPSLEAGGDSGSESQTFLKVDSRKKQLTLYDPASSPHSLTGHRRAATVAVPKIFAFDAVFTQDASQVEVCSGTVAEVLQSVVNGADGCIFCFGHVKLGKTHTMIGKDGSAQSLGIVPCAISWLFKLINERKEKTGTRFSVRVSAVEISGKDEELRDLLSEASAEGGAPDGQNLGINLSEDPISGTQLQNQSELRAPTAEKAAFLLDAAIEARSTNRAGAGEDERRNSHMLFTLHVYQYRMEKSGKGGMSGGRSRLHLIDLGSCEKDLSKSRDGGGGLCLSLNALGNVIMALANGAKHVPYRDSKLTMLLRESLGNINCRTTMIAHISDSPANYADSLNTIQLASRIHRMRKKKTKYASSSSGGDSSCEEGRIRRPPHLRPFHPRTVALDPDMPSFLSDQEYSSSSEQSCDTQKDCRDNEERCNTRMPPVGMSYQAGKRGDSFTSHMVRAPVEVCQMRPTFRERCLDRDILRATVTLQQPVELNGEDELVFTVVEELAIGSIVDRGRPSSIISFNSDCSLQALASGSRPVSIISSINDEFDAYTSATCGSEINMEVVTPYQEETIVCMASRGSSISSWLSEAKHVGPEGTFYLDSLGMFHCEPSPRDAKSSLNDSGFSFSDIDSDSVAVVDGCEKSASRKTETPSKMPLLRRGATTLGTVPVIHASTESKVVSEDELEVRCRGDINSFKTSSLKSDLSTTKITSSLKAKGPRGDSGLHYGSHMSLERTSATRTTPTAVSSKTGRGTIMGTKQAIRAANSRVSELASSTTPGKNVRASGDSDSGNDSGVNVGDDKSPTAMLPSPYSKITAPRRPQRYSSGHGSDNSSVLSGELPPAMGRTALFYHSGGSSGYESMIRDSEATGSASSALDSMSESGASSGRMRNSKPPKKRSNGFQRRRLIPAPMPDTSSLGKKAGSAGQWVDLPPMSGPLKEPFEIKVYEIDDVERLQRRRLDEIAEQPFQDVEKGLQYFNSKLKVLERRQQQVKELRAKHEALWEELEDTKARLMMDPRKWIGEFEVDQDLDKESTEYLDALAEATEELEFCVNLCKSRVMMVTCFDIGTPTGMVLREGPCEVEV
ncbi:hypothetical protein NHX12_019616 [Muraenolepis orangiensis]|uniref:Kinesin motor domain-containing protein n=1 Tax=Muraenolepis orangiensis TaxID=630683 RepID=A0A9Q0EX35_9TELE|nr:hypothetical protein NHX12_019616 [Muraenolepis orangiensis]